MHKHDIFLLSMVLSFLFSIISFHSSLPSNYLFVHASFLIMFISIFFFYYIYIHNKYYSKKYILDFIKRFEEVNQRKLIIAFDFDNTLCEEKYPQTGKAIQEMVELAKFLQGNGVYTILWTCRSGVYLENAKEWCEKQGLKFDKFNEHSLYMSLIYDCNTPKVYADFLFDDKAYNAFSIKNINGFKKLIKKELKLF